MMNKGILYKIFIIPLLLSFLVCPFHIYANDTLPSPFVGFNVNIIQYLEEYDYETSISGTSGTYSGSVARHTGSVSLSGDFTGIERTSGGVTYITTETTSGSVVGNNTATGTVTENAANESGSITLNLSSSTITHWNIYGLVEIEIVLDRDYIGYFNVSFRQGTVVLHTRNVYVNGNKATFTQYITASDNQIDNGLYNVVINSFELNDSSNNSFNFPIESFPFVNRFLSNPTYEGKFASYYGFKNYTWPMFDITAGDYIQQMLVRETSVTDMIFITNKSFSGLNGIKTFFELNNNHTFDEIFKSVSYFAPDSGIVPNRMSFYHYQFQSPEGAGTLNLRFTFLQDCIFIPIYYNQSTYANLSTDFALQFGLTNQLLDNLNIIANGTSSSNSSAGSLETVSDDISSSSDDLIQSEDSFNNSMNSNLQQIDTNINIGNLGNKFLASAEWVRVQFNTLTNGTPFGSVLSFSLLLGLALVLVGRIRK